MKPEITILIADDHEIVRRGLAMVLSLEPGFRVVGEAHDGAGAVAAATRLRPDVVLLDMKMPGTDGRAAAEKIKQRLPGVRVLMLSGIEITEDVFEALEAGVDGYLLKDVSPDELGRAIRTVAEGKSYIHAEITRALLERVTLSQRRPSGNLLHLTEREMQVLRLLATRATYREIGGQLFISEETVRSHVKNILGKLDQPNRPQAVVTALKLGLIELA
ncbi:MAG: response regulator transcription factor [Chloroflexi bacterium]|nr:response regulator transcription factor [Chloroflexota bacterium]